MITVYTINNCPYCNKIKELLIAEEMSFEEINCDLPENEEKFIELVKKTKSNSVPTIVVDKFILVPEVAFNTIDEGVGLIKRILAKLED